MGDRPDERARLRRFRLFQVGLPLAERGEAVHLGAMREGALAGSDVLRLARRRLLPQEEAGESRSISVGPSVESFGRMKACPL